jgi:nucleoside-diphosphate-sugar epimerase
MQGTKARRGQRVLVTGRASSVGSHLCDRLIAQGHEVYCVQRTNEGCWQSADEGRC